MQLPQYFLIGLAAGWLCGLLPHVGRRVSVRMGERLHERRARQLPRLIFKPAAFRRAALPTARLVPARPRHLADVRLGLMRRGF